MTSNPRQTRTAGSTDTAIVGPGDAKKLKTFMDRWVEPPLRPPAPSFMEYPHIDITRHGVLENMAPLGTMPSSKVKKLVKIEGLRRSTLAKKSEASVSTVSTPREAVTPEPPASHARTGSASHKIEESEWNPMTPVAQTSARKVTASDSVGRQSLPPQQSPYSASASPTKEELDLERVERAVEWACEEALAAGRRHTGYALRSLFQEHRSNPRMVKLFDSIATQEATENDQVEFRTLMEYKKREGRKSKKTEEMFPFSRIPLSSTPVQFSGMDFNSSPTKVVSQAAVDLAAGSPHKEVEGPAHKKHKGNHRDQNGDSHVNLNGNSSLANGIHFRTRSNSVVSSDSDLSSVDEALLTENNREQSIFSATSSDQAANKSQGTKTETSTTIADSDAMAWRNKHTQPMTQQKTLGPKLDAWDSNANSGAPSASSSHLSFSPSNNNNHTNMPARVSESFTTQPSDSDSQQPSSQLLQNSSLKSLKKSAGGGARDLDDNNRTTRLKRRARNITENRARIHDSFDRHRVVTRGFESEVEGGDSTATSGQPPKSGQVLRFRSSQASKRVNDESDDLSSPTLLSFVPDGAAGSTPNSRAGTPGILNRPSRKPKSGLRMKTSPMKKKAGPSAGIPRASGERSPVGNGAFPHNQDDNDDYCSSCGGNGDLVCCDGCTRSFHFRCVDPPLSESQLPDNWFCNACNALRNPRGNYDLGEFSELLGILQKKNPSAFHLPKDIREYFEGVRTGTEGEYEEGLAQKPKRNVGYEEAPDYLRLKDAKGNFILCHECHKGAGSGSPIIPCSYCGLQWHLDCLDPPQANPPPPGRLWRCPCHVDDLLAKMPAALGPAHRFRKIKGASVVRPAFPRGFKNDGHIDIELTLTDDEDEGFFDQKEYGRVYKLPEEGIKLDFISRVRFEFGPPAVDIPPPNVTRTPIKPNFTPADRHSLLEQQAALNFAHLAAQDGAPDGAQILIDALLSQASPAVVAVMAQGDAANLASNSLGPGEKQSLLAMKALIERALQKMEQPSQATKKAPEGVKEELGVEVDVEMLL